MAGLDPTSSLSSKYARVDMHPRSGNSRGITHLVTGVSAQAAEAGSCRIGLAGYLEEISLWVKHIK